MDELSFYSFVNQALILEILEQKDPEKNKQLLDLILKLNFDLITLQIADAKPQNLVSALAEQRLINHEN